MTTAEDNRKFVRKLIDERGLRDEIDVLALEIFRAREELKEL